MQVFAEKVKSDLNDPRAFIFPTDVNDFMKPWVQLGSALGGSLGSIWVGFGYMRMASGHFWVTLGSRWVREGCFGSFWDNYEITWGICYVYVLAF